MNALSSLSLLGVDVGFSAQRPTTGLAWCVDDEFGASKVHTDWSRRKAALPTGARFNLIAIDGPLPPSDAVVGVERGCERTFIRGSFAKRCKPGLSHIGYGLQLREAALTTAADALAVLDNDQDFEGPHVIPARAIVEAFPNAFLGVLLPDQVYAAGGWAKRKKFDWLYGHAVALQRFDAVFEILAWRNSGLLDAIKVEHDHERRAAYVCLLTAALAYTKLAHAVGDAGGGYFWLPPLDIWSPWAVDALEANRALTGREARLRA